MAGSVETADESVVSAFIVKQTNKRLVIDENQCILKFELDKRTSHFSYYYHFNEFSSFITQNVIW